MMPNITPVLKESLTYLCREYQKYNCISPDAWGKYDVKRGLRNANGTGVLAGLTSICDVVGYDLVEGERQPCDGRLIYRGVDVRDIVEAGRRDNRYMYEEVVWLLLFGSLPSSGELDMFGSVLGSLSNLPEGFAENMIMKSPSPNVMNAMARAVLALYSYDENAEDQSLENTLLQAVKLIACVPAIMTAAYQVKRRVFEKKSMYMHRTKPDYSMAQNTLRISRSNKLFSVEEARLLDLCFVLHADHGGGNNSAFATRVVTSSATDTYGAIAAALSSLKGRRHGGANIKVMEMLDEMKKVVTDYADDEQIALYLEGVLDRKYGDGNGLIYGVGHAVYTKDDPRAVILRSSAAALAHENGLDDDYRLVCAVERLAPGVVARKKGLKSICANVDLFSGLVFRIMNIPLDLYTPLFAVSRMAGWCAHLIEERLFGNRIIRPAYKYIGAEHKYVPLKERP
jgi:citrate synthase